MKTIRSAFSLVLLLLSLSITFHGIIANATSVYKSTDEKGKVTFSDKELPDSEAILLPKLQTYTPSNSLQAPEPERQSKEPAIKKYSILFTAPEPESIFTSEVEDIEVSVFVSPDLQGDDRIVLKLNDQPFGQYQTDTVFHLGRLYRGTYKLQAFVYHKSGKGKPKGQTEVIRIHQIREMLRSK